MNEVEFKWRPVLFVAALGFVLHLTSAVAGHYGYFIDEFYYLACARHLAWGYIDHPPLAPAVLALVSETLGTSKLAVRLLPALCGVAVVLLTGRLASRFGASAGGQILAAVGTTLIPTLLVLFGVFTTNAFDILLWIVALSLLFELEMGRTPRIWIVLGLVLGLAQMTKHTAFTLALAMALATVVTPLRRHYRTRWPWLGAGVALLVVMPNIVWEVHHDWITLEFARNATLNKNLSLAPGQVLLRQVLFGNPGSLPMWLGGLVLLLSGKTHGAGRAVGFTCLLLLAAAVSTGQARPDRIVAIFPVLLAAGACLWTKLAHVKRGRAYQALAAAVVVLPGLALLPLFAPVLSAEVTSAWGATLGLEVQIERGPGKVASLPQWLADRFGWPEYTNDVTRAVEQARDRLTERQQKDLVIITNSYGHAGALELFGRGLPPVYSTHNNYVLWGPPDHEVDAAIITGEDAESLGELFGHIELLAVHGCDYCTAWRDRMPIWLVSNPRMDLSAHWMDLRHIE